ncbi:DMT family transporter [Deinococcus radiodurans]|nr:DMT family transporter [Deinococcus radiodurans]
MAGAARHPGAGLGLSAGGAFNLRLLRGLRVPLAASLVNFLVGTTVLGVLWLLGWTATARTTGHRCGPSSAACSALPTSP